MGNFEGNLFLHAALLEAEKLWWELFLDQLKLGRLLHQSRLLVRLQR